MEEGLDSLSYELRNVRQLFLARRFRPKDHKSVRKPMEYDVL